MNHSEGIEISVVVPVYRAEHTLHLLVERIMEVMERLGRNFELILVEDCGKDSSWKIVKKLAEHEARIRGYRLSKNFGQHAATMCGFSKSRGDWVITLDDDLEHPPEHIPDLLKAANEDVDLVYAVFENRTHSKWRNLSSDFGRWLFSRAIPSLNRDYSSFRVIRGKIARELTNFDSPFPFVDGYLAWLTNRCGTVKIFHGERAQGESNYGINKLLKHMVNIFITFSDMPLRIATWFGILSSALGLIWLGIILIKWLVGGITVSGYASIMGAILLFGGVQLLVLGVFGQYIARINFKTSKQPLYLVQESVESE